MVRYNVKNFQDVLPFMVPASNNKQVNLDQTLKSFIWMYYGTPIEYGVFDLNPS